MASSFPSRISFAEARRILARVAAKSQLPSERVALSRALGRTLAEAVVAACDLPGFDNSAMDGYAVRSEDLRSDGGETWLTISGEQFAGINVDAEVGAGQCVRVTTGAPLPAGADAVVMKEQTRLDGDRVNVIRAVRAGTNIRRAGEDVRAGETVLLPGQVLAPARLSLAAAIGAHDVLVHRRPTVAVFTTGDELKPPGQALAAGEIYDSNRVLLQSLLLADGLEPVAWPLLPDNPERLIAALRDAAFSFDVVITCGGVSAGEKDYLPDLLAEHGEVHFWKVLMRPGMPVLAGRLGDAHLLCLPGNPVSVFATYLTLVREFIDLIQARIECRPRQFARLTAPIQKTHERLEFLRGSLSCDETGQWQVAMNPADGSHRLRAVADSNALIIVPEGLGDWAVGSVLEVLPLAQY